MTVDSRLECASNRFDPRLERRRLAADERLERLGRLHGHWIFGVNLQTETTKGDPRQRMSEE